MKQVKQRAEEIFASLIKSTDEEIRWKIRDEFLGFRRRLRLYCGSDDPMPYVLHIEDTVARLPEYQEWFIANDYPREAEAVAKLSECFAALLEEA